MLNINMGIKNLNNNYEYCKLNDNVIYYPKYILFSSKYNVNK